MPWIYKPKKYNNQQNRIKRQDIYNTTLWKKMRRAKLMEQPLCEICLLQDIITLGEDVHHLISFMEAQDPFERDRLAYDSNNLIVVCRNCHNSIHNGYLKGCKSISEIEEKIKMKE